MARILVDGRFVGVGDSQTRYVLELVKGIIQLDHTNSYTLLLRPQGIKDAENFLNLDLPFSNWEESNSDKKFKPLKTKYKNLSLQVLDIAHYSLSEQTKLLKYLNEEKFDLVHFTQFNHAVRYHGDYVITIQDLTMVGHLHRQNFIKGIAFRAVMKSAAKDSKKIIAVSKTTMDDIIEYYHVDKEKFAVVYHGVDHDSFNLSVKSKTSAIEKFKKKYDISDEYILYTGMWKRHKNLLRLLSAYEIFIRRPKTEDRILQTPQLVLVGKIDSREKEIVKEIERINQFRATDSGLQTPIVTTDFITEEELPIAYAGAFAYCIPSLSEGFGWPPLEAMACGVPVISSKESCMPEILGDAPLYFDAYDIEDIAKKMSTITTDKELRKKLIKKGLEQVQKYQWQKTAEETLEVYKKLLHNVDE